MNGSFDDDLEEGWAVGVVRYEDRIRWFRMLRDNWILDWEKWRNHFISEGYAVPELDVSSRFGIAIANEDTAEEFIVGASRFEVTTDHLRAELLRRFSAAESWWDVGDLFPIVFVDFDHRRFGAFYFQGAKMEKYVPVGWIGEFVDFASSYGGSIFSIIR